MTDRILGVYLSADHDLKAHYGAAFAAQGPDVAVLSPEEVTDPAQIRFAVCWIPAPGAFDAYPNLGMASVVGAGVDGLLGRPDLPDIPVCRVRDPAQGAQMAGYALHEILHVARGFGRMAAAQARAEWAPEPAPPAPRVAVLGNGSMGAAIVRSAATLGLPLTVAARSRPVDPVPGVRYVTGPLSAAVAGADFVVNVLPLTPETRGVLNRDLFARMAKGGWLIQIGRGEHLVEADLTGALDSGQLAGATLDVFAREPLPPGHPFWHDPRLRLTPHVASSSAADTTAEQIAMSARQLRDGQPLSLAIDRARGY
ncbi:NAD(P)-dependent oxidoreductase [Paenirhodobacter sp.]|uniref:NAD(P)-dependent oxidoreductase n=1 Tax=Paenirhodobacter sp. TaxID=1965326 RepID=UPI003B413C69